MHRLYTKKCDDTTDLYFPIVFLEYSVRLLFLLIVIILTVCKVWYQGLKSTNRRKCQTYKQNALLT